MGDSKPPMWQQLLMTAVSVAAVAAMLWMEAPPWQRDQIRNAARSRLAAAAWRSGRQAMSLEIEQGRPGPGYQLTYLLSRLRDAAGLP
jgi:hypothetical protein